LNRNQIFCQLTYLYKSVLINNHTRQKKWVTVWFLYKQQSNQCLPSCPNVLTTCSYILIREFLIFQWHYDDIQWTPSRNVHSTWQRWYNKGE